LAAAQDFQEESLTMSTALFLTPDELAELTGYSMPRSQRKWLDANGYRYALNANNQPKVARDYLLSRLGVTVATAANAEAAATPRPNFGALKSAA
jgi:hypothetical protein